MLGMYTDFAPKHVKRFADLAGEIRFAFEQYSLEVKESRFPAGEHSFPMDESLLESLEHPERLGVYIPDTQFCVQAAFELLKQVPGFVMLKGQRLPVAGISFD